MLLSDLDTSGYLYNPLDSKDIRYLISTHQEFQKEIKINLSKVVVYIILMYDLNTELRRVYADYFTRKRQAAIMAGFNINKNGRFVKAIEDMLIGNDQVVNNMVVRYAMLFNNPDYLSLVAYTEMLVREAEASLSEKYDGNTINNIIKLNKEIKILMTNIFGGDPSKNLIKALYRTMEREKLRYRPEAVAEDIKDEKLDIDARPYGELV